MYGPPGTTISSYCQIIIFDGMVYSATKATDMITTEITVQQEIFDGCEIFVDRPTSAKI